MNEKREHFLEKYNRPHTTSKGSFLRENMTPQDFGHRFMINILDRCWVAMREPIILAHLPVVIKGKLITHKHTHKTS